MTISLVLDNKEEVEPLPPIPSGGDTSRALPTVGNIQTGNSEADQVIRTFLSKTQQMVTERQYSSFLQSYDSIFSSIDDVIWEAKQYAKVTGNPMEDFLDLTQYEKFVYDYTVIDMYYTLLCEYNPERQLGSKELFIDHISHDYTYLKELDPQIGEAYRDIMMWQYDYYTENGVPYDFFTGERYGGDQVPTAAPEPTKEEQQVEQAFRELAGEQPASKSSKAVPVVIIIAIAAVAICLVLYRRNRAARR
jgi:hypothetical protein